MALKMKNSGGYSPLRIQRSYQTYRSGAGGNLQALADTLDIALESAPKIVDHEAKQAWERGMRARIDGVQAENANAANKSLLGFMFSKQAMDGFHYQDALMDAPLVMAGELMMLQDSLREATSPDQIAAFIQESDNRIRTMMQGKPDVYRYTMSQELLKARESMIKTATGWVQSNRERGRRVAAATAAKAQAESAAMAISADIRSAMDAEIGGGFNPLPFTSGGFSG